MFEAGVSLIIPFYNEASLLESTLETSLNCLVGLKRPYEMILADDGSTDESPAIASRFKSRFDEHVTLVRNPVNRGRGSVLRAAFSKARMPIGAYIDADLEIGIEHLPQLLVCLESPKVSIVTGSKVLSPSGQTRAFHRRAATAVLNRLIRWGLGSRLSDHQCGLKAFRKDAIDALLPHCREEGWAWDTEILLLAQQRGFEVAEVPVDVVVRRKTTVAFATTSWMFLRKVREFRRRGLAV